VPDRNGVTDSPAFPYEGPARKWGLPYFLDVTSPT